jgi:hypothetical protein
MGIQKLSSQIKLFFWKSEDRRPKPEVGIGKSIAVNERVILYRTIKYYVSLI